MKMRPLQLCRRIVSGVTCGFLPGGMACLGGMASAAAAEGEFVVPGIRADGGTRFSYWDRFVLPSGTVYSYLVPHYPNVLGQGDAAGNPSNFNDDAILVQVRSETAFLTGSAAIYDFQESVGFEVRYRHTGDEPVTNVIFQVQTGGRRFERDDIRLVPVSPEDGSQDGLTADFRALDDPAAGGFTDRLMSAFQWDLTERDVRDFVIAFHSSGSSMPLYEAQLDVVAGGGFERELGTLVDTGVLPSTVWGVAGHVYRDLPPDAEQRFFLPGDIVPLVAEAAEGYQQAGWLLADGTVSESAGAVVVAGETDVTVRALFSPVSWESFREHSFSHGIPVAGAPPEHTDDAISGPDADPDGDGLSNFAEYAAGGDPMVPDAGDLLPRPLIVMVDGQRFPALEYVRHAASESDLEWRIEESVALTGWATVETVPVSDVLTSRGTRRVTVRRRTAAGAGPVYLRAVAVKGGQS